MQQPHQQNNDWSQVHETVSLVIVTFKQKTAAFGVNLMISQVLLYRAAQEHSSMLITVGT